MIREKFDKWNVLKKDLHINLNETFYVKQREIWSVYMWQNIWFEEDWKMRNLWKTYFSFKENLNNVFMFKYDN